MKKILFIISLLSSIQFNYAQEYLLTKKWKSTKSISSKVSQIFTLEFTSQEGSLLYGTISDYTSDDSSYCSALFEARILPNKKLLIEGKNMTINQSSKKHKHDLCILMLDIQKNELKGSIAKEGNYITLLFNKKDDSIIFIPEYKKEKITTKNQTDSVSCMLLIKDNNKPDGDIIKIDINDVAIVDSMVLNIENTIKEIKLVHGENKILVMAIDEGSKPPTTVHITIMEKDTILLELPIFLKKGEQKIERFNYHKK